MVSPRLEERSNDVEVKIEEPKWKAELHKMKAQIRGMRNNVCNRAKDCERMDVIEPLFTNEIMETSLSPRF